MVPEKPASWAREAMQVGGSDTVLLPPRVATIPLCCGIALEPCDSVLTCQRVGRFGLSIKELTQNSMSEMREHSSRLTML